MDIADLDAGKSYGCRFRVQTFVGADSKPYSTKHLQPGEKVKDAKPGEYRGFGAISKRDCERRLLEIVDLDNPGFTWTVSWSDVWDVDAIEWTD